MEYICQHCGADLDEGDIYDFFLKKNNDPLEALKIASYYGWSQTNKKHFNRSIIIQSEKCPQYIICPDCQ